jgi:hypothetical protein
LYADATIEAEFEAERARLIAALGYIIDGGVIENVRYMPPLGDRPPCRFEIGAAVWPFPLEGKPAKSLAALGFVENPAESTPHIARFRRPEDDVALAVMDGGEPEWAAYRALSIYLQEHPSDLNLISAETIQEQARSWWLESQGFTPLLDWIAELNSYPGNWCVASGWAVDLFLGRVTRLHGDLDIAIPRNEQLHMQSYLTDRGWRMLAPNEGKLEPWPTGFRLELPRHQAHGPRDEQFLDLLFSEIEGDLWRFRRNQSIVRTMDRAIMRTADGIPYLAPEIVLLFKSRNHAEDRRTKDREDFMKVLPLLEPERRAWLQWALTVLDPGHPWIELLR